jgi:LPXTG-motif cell wall-anchored protein
VNSGAIESTETPNTPSNQVVTQVVAVLGVKVVRAPKLPFTGIPAQEMGLVGLLMLGAGIILTSVRRKEQ